LFKAILQTFPVGGVHELIAKIMTKSMVADAAVFTPKRLGHWAHVGTNCVVLLFFRELAIEQRCSVTHEIGGSGGFIVHHIDHRGSIVDLGVLDQMPTGPSNVFDVNAAKHLARFVDYTRFALSEGIEN
jgi:hypothetical protein